MGRRYLLLLSVATLLLGLAVAGPTNASAESVIVQTAKGKLPAAEIPTPAGVKVLPGISSGTLAAATDKDLGDVDGNDVRADNTADPGGEKAGTTIRTVGCANRNGGGERNVRVNQDCTFRRQAEELIKVNPIDQRNLVAGQNDSRVGFNHCGFDFSFDGGRHWGDGIPPFYQHINAPTAGHTIMGGPGSGHTYDAASDPALAVDSRGRAFFSCVMFDINTAASGLFTTASVPGAGGSFYNNVPAAGSAGVVVEDNTAQIVHDKNFITADANPSSPNRDNVYTTWTVFKQSPTCGHPADGTLRRCSNAIFASVSTDHAVTWSQPEEISGAAPFCFLGDFFDPTRPANACDFDQGSDPIVQGDGSLTVAFHNGNTAPTSPNAQQLAVTCHPSGKSEAGTAHLNCASPVRVGDDVIVGQPRCNFGRGPEACVPGAFIRTNDFPRISRSARSGDLFTVWQDYRGGEMDIHLSTSRDGGSTWAEAASPVNPDTGFDHYMPATDGVGSGGDRGDGRVAVSYYRTARVPNENDGRPVFDPTQPGVQQEPSTYDLAGGRGGRTPFAARQVSPSFPPATGGQAGFNGDYSGLVVVGDDAHPIWSDTRNTAPAGQVAATPAPDEDIFTDSVEVPGE